jgi:hypothetical protein
MNVAKLNTFVDRLIAKTAAGDLRWRESLRPNSYQIDFAGYSVICEMHSAIGLGTERGLGYSMKILDDHGEMLIEASASKLDVMHQHHVPFEKLQQLFEAAKRSLLTRSEDALDALLAKLA